MNRIHLLYVLLLITSLIRLSPGCVSSHENAESKEETKTPVTITSISIEPMSESLEFNAVSGFLRKHVVKSSVTGVIKNIDINLGDAVDIAERMFSIQTKEASVLDNTNSSDSVISFKGEINIKATKDGVITSIAHQKGDYVVEGDELATVSEQNSLVFLLEVPFELRQYVKLNGHCEIRLADHKILNGIVDRKLPVMDMQSQTEQFVVLPNTTEKLPENLIAKIDILKNSIRQTIVLPKQAILADET